MWSDTVSPREAWWILGAFAGVGFTVAAIVLYVRICLVIAEEVRRRRASFTGPRWAYGFGTLACMCVFLPGWLAFLCTGILAGIAPDPPKPPEATLIETLFEYLILGGELSFAAGQVGIVLVWWAVRRAVVFVPAIPSLRPDRDDLRERVRRTVPKGDTDHGHA